MTITRASILVIAALAGILCIYLGWRLYKDAVISKSKGELEGTGFKVSITTASPGIFLAAFGIWLLLSIVNRPLVVESQTGQSPSAKPPSSQSPPSLSTPPFAFLDARAAEPAKKKPSRGPEDCLVTWKRTEFYGGQGGSLTKESFRSAITESIGAIQKAGPAGIESAAERAALLVTLRQILNATE